MIPGKNNLIQHRRYSNKHGLSLVETGIAVTLLGLMLSLLIDPSGKVHGNAYIHETREQLKTVALSFPALSGYKISQALLPCPANINLPPSDINYGKSADCNNIASAKSSLYHNTYANDEALVITGMIPFVSLGLPESMAYDKWGNRIRYTVLHMATASSSSVFDPASSSVDTPNNASSPTLPLRIQSKIRSHVVNIGQQGSRHTWPAFALISHGRGGKGAISHSGHKSPCPTDAEQSQEHLNCQYKNDTTTQISILDPSFVSSRSTQGSQEYADDIVYWESIGTLVALRKLTDITLP